MPHEGQRGLSQVSQFTLSTLWLIIYFSVSLSQRRSTQFLLELNPLSLNNKYFIKRRR